MSKNGYFVKYSQECLGHKFSNGDPLTENITGYLSLCDVANLIDLTLMDKPFKRTVFMDIEYDFKILPDSFKFEPMTDEIREKNLLMSIAELGECFSDFDWS